MPSTTEKAWVERQTELTASAKKASGSKLMSPADVCTASGNGESAASLLEPFDGSTEEVCIATGAPCASSMLRTLKRLEANLQGLLPQMKMARIASNGHTWRCRKRNNSHTRHAYPSSQEIKHETELYAVVANGSAQFLGFSPSGDHNDASEEKVAATFELRLPLARSLIT
ncbi:hypothetical protein R1sor_023096 [Riccia sorocarpa]|uniref:Uncharacterized protein n=1 Tax=Riccia sorocarpa TaxID=122646 RepID=A0ABD3GQ14_9MARC